MKHWRDIGTILAGVACVSSAALFFAALREEKTEPAPAKQEKTESNDTSDVAAPFRLIWVDSAFEEIAGRPLFYPSRRQPPPVPPKAIAAVPRAPTVAPPPPPPSGSLVGIIIDSSSRIAVVRSSASNQVIKLAEGDPFEGWTLGEVAPGRALFRRDSAEVVMTFPEPKRSQSDPAQSQSIQRMPGVSR